MQPKTIHRHLVRAATKATYTVPQAAVNLIADTTTYFGQKWGVMALYDAIGTLSFP